MQIKFNNEGKQLYDYYTYRVTLITDGRTYVGKRYISLWYTPADGMKEYTPGEYYGSGDHIKNAIKCYGVENFRREVVDEYHDITEDEIKKIEKELIKSEWAAGHGEFNLAAESHDGNIFDGMPAWMKDEILQRTYKTKTEKYGDPAGQLHTPEVIEKSIRTRIERYGSANGMANTPEASRKRIQTQIEKYGSMAIHTKEAIRKAHENRDKTMAIEWVFCNPEKDIYKVHVLNWTSRFKRGFTKRLCKYEDWEQYKLDNNLLVELV